jgi:hypothetical protein
MAWIALSSVILVRISFSAIREVSTASGGAFKKIPNTGPACGSDRIWNTRYEGGKPPDLAIELSHDMG